MATNNSNSKGSKNPFLTPELTAAPNGVDHASLAKQQEAAAPKATASVREAEAANPKNATREVSHPELKKLGIDATIVNAVNHTVRIVKIDSIELIEEKFPGIKYVKDLSSKGGRVYTYDPIILADHLAKLPKRAGRTASGSSVKYLIESSESLGLDGQHYVVCDAVENLYADGKMTRVFTGVKAHGTYSAATRTGEFTLVRGEQIMKIAMIVKSAKEMYPENYEADGAPKTGIKVPANRMVFVMTPKITAADGTQIVQLVKSYGQTNTLNGLMRFYDRIVFE